MTNNGRLFFLNCDSSGIQAVKERTRVYVPQIKHCSDIGSDLVDADQPRDEVCHHQFYFVTFVLCRRLQLSEQSLRQSLWIMNEVNCREVETFWLQLLLVFLQTRHVISALTRQMS